MAEGSYRLVNPLSQYGWKLWQQRQTETKKKVLREAIRELAQFRQVALPDDPRSARIKSDADREYAEAVAKLAEICALEKIAVAERTGVTRPAAAVSANQLGNQDNSSDTGPVAALPGKPWFQRWFLLYVPARPIAWIPQTIYFLFLFFTVLGAFGIVADAKNGGTVIGLLGLSPFVLVTLLFRGWAVRANTNPALRAATSRRRSANWIPVSITVLVVFFGICVFVGIAMGDGDDVSLAILRQNYLAALGTVLVTAAIVFYIWYRRRQQA
jgi:hypothetical protein